MSDTVLIVDDSLTVRMDLAEAFESSAFRTVLCATAAEARSALAREAVDVVVLDVMLPDGDGIDLLREIRASSETSAAMVMVLSAETEVKDRIRGLETGADEYVGKPYDAGYVVAKARLFLRTRRVTGQAGNRPTVLVIDDSITFREEMRRAFEGAGYVVVETSTGEEGLLAAASHRPDAVVVDGMLPGMDGGTVIRHIRLDMALQSIPCLLLTASEDRGAELRALDAGADAFVRKDEDIELILAKLAAVLRRPANVEPDHAISLLGPKRVLTVDDSETYLQELVSTLHGEGYDVVPARSGEEAIDLLAVQPVDCILLDLMMPGLGGQETCRRIRSAPLVRDIPLIMLTAVEDRAAMLDGLGAGADDYIPKSSEFQVLKARVRAQLRRKQFEDENRRIRETLLRKELEASEARAARELAEARAILVEELQSKNTELEAFSYSISHDLRAPLRAIDGYTLMLEEDYAAQLDEEGRRLLAVVRDSSVRMGQLIDDLLMFSRSGRESLNAEPVDMEALVAQIWEEIRVDNSVEFRMASLPAALGGRSLLKQVWINLLSNAVKYSKNRERPVVQVAGEQSGGEIVYSVRDNGAGFDMRFYEKLFGVFQRLHSLDEFPGTGVGLAIVQRIVTRHGGRVWAEGKVNEGAVFYVALPAGDAARAKRDNGIGKAAVQIGGAAFPSRLPLSPDSR